MATQVFLLSTAATTHRGTNTANLIGSAVGWLPLATGTARGSGVVASGNTATVAGTTNGVEITNASAVRLEWLTPPVDADVTISGTITGNIWASESAAQANTAINFYVDKVAATDGTLTRIVTSARTTEIAGATRAANNFTASPSSTSVNKGDRLRIVIFGDDAGTMGSGRTFNIGYNGTSAAADGDTYITFNETFGFQSPTPFLLQESMGTAGVDATTIGGTAGTQKVAQSFTAPSTATIVQAELRFDASTGTPTDGITVEIQTDSSGSPSGTVVGTSDTTDNADLTASAWNKFYPSASLTSSTTYWLVAYRTGAVDASNRRFWMYAGSSVITGDKQGYNGSSWASVSGNPTFDFTFRLYSGTPDTPTGSTLYLTNTASAVSTSDTDYEAWTARGNSAVSQGRDPVAGWTTPLQFPTTPVSWWTRPLQAFTLAGPVKINIRANQGAASVNASIGVQIARTDGDGTNATVWGYANRDAATTSGGAGELATSETAYTVYVSGDDLSISDGQRLRVRVFLDDCADIPMAFTAGTNIYIDGPTAGASGDTYLIFGQTLTEFDAGGDATATPGVIARSFSVPQITAEAHSAITPATIDRGFSVPQASAGVAASITPATITRAFTVEQVTLAAASSITPATIARSFSIPQASPSAGASITPATIAQSFTLPQPGIGTAVNPGVIARLFSLPQASPSAASSITPTTIARSFTIPQASPSAGSSITPAAIAQAFSVPQVSLSAASTITPATIARAFAVPQTSASASSTLTPGVIARAFALGQVSAGAATVATPAVIARSFALGAPTISAAASITPAVIARSFSLGQASITASSAITPAVIARSFAVPQATPSASSAITPAVIARAFALGQATPLASSVMTPAVIARSFTIPQASPQTAAGTTATPGVIARSFTIPQASPLAASVVTPQVISRSFALGQVSLSAASRVTPAVIARTFALGAPTISAASRITPQTIAGAFVLPQATGTGQTGAFPQTISRSFALGQVSLVTGTGATITPAAISGTFALPSVALVAEVLLTPDAVSLIFVLPEPQVLTVEPILISREGPRPGGAAAGEVLVASHAGSSAGGAASGDVLVASRGGPTEGGAASGDVLVVTREGETPAGSPSGGVAVITRQGS